MPCPASYVCVPASDMELIVKGLIVVLSIAGIALLLTLVDDDPPKEPPSDRPKAKSQKGK